MRSPAPTGPDRPAGPPLTLFVAVNAPAVIALALAVAALAAGSAPARLAATFALITTLAAAGAANLLLAEAFRGSAARLSEAAHDAEDARRQLRAVFDTAADGIVTFDEGGWICTANAAAGRMFGHDAAGLVGQSIELLLPGARGPGGKPLVGTGEGRSLGVSSPFDGKHRDGHHFPVAVGISKVRAKGRALFTAIIHDLTPLHQARDAAEAGSRAKSSFLVHMSHELRTPLGGILGMAELLGSSPLSPEQRRHLDALVRSAEGLLASLESLLDYSRLEAGELALTRRAFSLRQLVGEVLAPLAERARAKGLRLVPQVAPELPDWYAGDAGRLRQALHALADNAVKFTRRGEVALRVGAGSGGVVFEVRDTGSGVRADQRESIFQPFEQGDSSSTKLHGGLGLGLSIAARLVDLMGGQISVDSAEGQGSTFRLAVPLEPAEAPAPAASPVLLVVGDTERRRALWQQVSGWGWPASAVGTGKAAMAELMAAVVRGAPFRLVVVDAELPDVAGADVLRWLGGRDECRCPVVLLGAAGPGLPAGASPVVLPRDAGGPRLREAIQQALASAALAG